MHALRLVANKAGIVAFSRTGDTDVGEYQDAVIHARYGEVPKEFDPPVEPETDQSS